MSRSLVLCAAIPLAAIALALGATGCIGDDEEGEISIPSVTEETTTPETESLPTETSVPETTTTETAPSKKPANPGQPDTPQNDVPPPAGSPEERFERFCEQNPGACG